jgi:hypothetical protein
MKGNDYCFNNLGDEPGSLSHLANPSPDQNQIVLNDQILAQLFSKGDLTEMT